MPRLVIAFVLAAAWAAGARADDPILRRGGEWRVTMTSSGGLNLPNVTRCFKPAHIADLAAGSAKGHCSSSSVHAEGGKFFYDAVCPVGASQSAIHSVVTPAGDTSYHAEINFTYKPAMNGVSEMHISQDAKWLGPCQAGETPAD